MLFEDFNNDVLTWKGSTERTLQNQASVFGIIHRAGSPSPGPSMRRIRSTHTTKDGLVSKISFKFPRNLIFVHKGAGNGRGGTKGSKWITASGKSKSTNPASLGKMGTGGRIAKPWFNQVMEGPQGIEYVATLAAEKIGDAITGNFLIK
jgi:hypothetical protein